MARGLNVGSRGSNLSNWGTSKSVLGFACSVDVWERSDFPPPKKVGINDHNATCQYDQKWDIMSHVWPCLHELTRVRIDSGHFRIVSAKLRSSEFR